MGVFARPNGEQVLVHRCLGCGFERHNRIAGDDDAGPAGQPVGGAFLLLDVFFGLAQAFGRYGGIRLDLVSHRSPQRRRS